MKNYIILGLIIITFTLSACGKSSNANTDMNVNTDTNVNADTNTGQELIIDENTTKNTIITGLPDRAKDLGLTEPEDMILDPIASKISSVNNQDEGFDSVILIYKGDYDQAIQQAKIIADVADLKVNKEFEMAKKISQKSTKLMEQLGEDSRDSIQGIVYSNHSLTDANIEFLINVSVDQDGTLTIEASNFKQLEQAKK